MSREILLAILIMSVGLSIAGIGTHFYQMVRREPANLRYDGKTFAGTMGHVLMSFVCGPYIMLRLGWQQDEGGTISISAVLLSAVVAFGWAFITGLLFMAVYAGVT